MILNHDDELGMVISIFVGDGTGNRAKFQIKRNSSRLPLTAEDVEVVDLQRRDF